MISIGRRSLVRSLMKQANCLQQHYRKDKVDLVRRFHWVFSLDISITNHSTFNYRKGRRTNSCINVSLEDASVCNINCVARRVFTYKAPQARIAFSRIGGAFPKLNVGRCTMGIWLRKLVKNRYADYAFLKTSMRVVECYRLTIML